MPWPEFVLAIKNVAAREARLLIRQMSGTNWGIERALAMMFGEGMATLEYDATMMRVEKVGLVKKPPVPKRVIESTDG